VQKKGESVDMQFWLWAQLGLRNHESDESPDLPTGMGNFYREKKVDCIV